MNYTVEQALGPSPWQSQQGATFHEWRLKLSGVEKLVSINQKPDSPPPTVGQTVNLDLSPHPKFPDLMRGKRLQEQRPPATASARFTDDPTTRASIEAQVSLKSAAEYCASLQNPVAANEILLVADAFYAWLSGKRNA